MIKFLNVVEINLQSRAIRRHQFTNWSQVLQFTIFSESVNSKKIHLAYNNIVIFNGTLQLKTGLRLHIIVHRRLNKNKKTKKAKTLTPPENLETIFGTEHRHRLLRAVVQYVHQLHPFCMFGYFIGFRQINSQNLFRNTENNIINCLFLCKMFSSNSFSQDVSRCALTAIVAILAPNMDAIKHSSWYQPNEQNCGNS